MTHPMDYVERLIRRALAVPRDQAPSLFDPFDQVAPFVHEATLSLDSTVSPGTPIDGADRPGATAKAARADGGPHPSVAQPTRVESPDDGLGRIEARVDVPIKVPTPAVHTRAASGESVAVPEPKPLGLARADAFMRALALPTAPVERPEAGGPTKADAAELTPLAPPNRILPLLPPLPSPPALLMPNRPRREVRPDPEPTPPGVPASAAAAAFAAQTSARDPARPAQLERIISTTVVVAPSSRRFDDLAHSSGISRFGIGQS